MYLHARKLLITVVGFSLTLLGLILIILPGPAMILLPLGLGILALEYPFAKKWLRLCQRKLSQSARAMDRLVKNWRR